jgi:hypothetical protein
VTASSLPLVGTEETAIPALPYDCFRPETGPGADALGGRLITGEDISAH